MDMSSQPAASGGQVSVIGEGIAVHGNIEATIDLQIEGKVVGDVRCGTLLLGANAEITGNVQADRIRVAGTINGSIETGDVAIEATARVMGDLTYSRLKIANGGVLEGKLTYVPREEPVEVHRPRLVESRQPEPPQTRTAQAQGAHQERIYIE